MSWRMYLEQNDTLHIYKRMGLQSIKWSLYSRLSWSLTTVLWNKKPTWHGTGQERLMHWVVFNDKPECFSVQWSFEAKKLAVEIWVWTGREHAILVKKVIWVNPPWKGVMGNCVPGHRHVYYQRHKRSLTWQRPLSVPEQRKWYCLQWTKIQMRNTTLQLGFAVATLGHLIL